MFFTRLCRYFEKRQNPPQDARKDSAPKESPLIALPPELRNAIYELVLYDMEGVHFRPCQNGLAVRRIARQPKNILALAQTCKSIRKESLPLFFSLNSFHFLTGKAPNTHYFSHATACYQWMRLTGRQNSNNVRRIDLEGPKLILHCYPGCVKGWIHRCLSSNISKMLHERLLSPDRIYVRIAASFVGPRCSLWHTVCGVTGCSYHDLIRDVCLAIPISDVQRSLQDVEDVFVKRKEMISKHRAHGCLRDSKATQLLKCLDYTRDELNLIVRNLCLEYQRESESRQLAFGDL